MTDNDTLRIARKRIKDTKDCRLTDENGEDLARVNDDGIIVYPEDTALQLIRGIRRRERMLDALEEQRTMLRQYRAKPADLKPLDFSSLTRNTKHVFTHVRFENYDMREALTTKDKDGNKTQHNWLELGQSSISTTNDRTGEALLGARMRDGITDFEHDSCYIVWIKLVGLRWTMNDYNVSYFEANITPDYDNIKIYDPSFKPEEVEGAQQCEVCDDKHWILPDGYFTPGASDLCRLVAGKRISISTGPLWTAIEPED